MRTKWLVKDNPGVERGQEKREIGFWVKFSADMLILWSS